MHPRLIRTYLRLLRHACGKYSRVTFRRTPGSDPDTYWSAELWTWFRVDRRWELALVARGPSKADAASDLLDGVLAMGR